MKMSINQEKSFILHSHSRGIKYLGAFLRYYKKNAIRKRNDGVDSDSVTKQVPHLQERAINSVQYRAPIESMFERLVNKGLAKKRPNGTVRGSAYIRYSMLEDETIVCDFVNIPDKKT